MTESKHESEEAVEDTAARVEVATATDVDTETRGKHATGDGTAAAEEVDAEPGEREATEPKRQTDWSRVVAFGVLPALAFLLALGAAFLKFQDSAVRDSAKARDESVQVAKDSTTALLSYKPDTVEKQLNDARGRLTGEFRDRYTSLINQTVIVGDGVPTDTASSVRITLDKVGDGWLISQFDPV